MTKVAVYDRYSLPRDDMDEYVGLFIDKVQKQLDGIEIVNVYIDNGLGNKYKENTEIENVIQDLIDGKFELIIIRHINRLSRIISVIEKVKNIELIKNEYCFYEFNEGEKISLNEIVLYNNMEKSINEI